MICFSFLFQLAKLRAEQASNLYKAAIEDLRETQTQADRSAALAATAAANAAKIGAQMSTSNAPSSEHASGDYTHH